ncbi:MAG: hypothetical protein RL701_4464 [Pseudomonadota bacterium]
MGFRALRVINEDRVEANRGFGTHGHRDMEIISYVIEGELQHRDSLGNGSVIRPGDVQRMSAGAGVLHSEHNPSRAEAVHFLQIWLQPAQNGSAPSYEQKAFTVEERTGRLCLIASPSGQEGSVTVHADANIYSAFLPAGTKVELTLALGRHAYVQVARGSARVQSQTLKAGDGASLSDETLLQLEGLSPDPAELLIFDLA